MISSNNLKNMLTNLFSKSKEETDKQYDHLTTEMNKGWISSGNANKITNGNEVNDTPVGSIISFMGNSAPPNYLICDGTEYNIEEYKELADFFNTQFGTYNYFGGNGETTFKVPDLRGEFLRGTGENTHYDDSNNIHQGNGADVGVHQHATRHTNYRLSYDGYYMGWVPDSGTKVYTGIDSTAFNDGITNNGVSRWMVPTRSLANSGGKLFITSRPTNTSVLYCIKYKTTSSINISLYESHTYSEEEQLIGQWINGKPLYRKVIRDYISGSGSREYFLKDKFENAEEYVIESFYAFATDSYSGEGIVVSSSNSSTTKYDISFTSFNPSTGRIWIINGENAYRYVQLIIRYTKTTDEPFPIDEDIAWYALDSEVDEIINRLGE